MISSMTGYASQQRITSSGVLQIELRSVNQRYLELQLKLDEQFRIQEADVREQLKSRLGRGKIECRISLAKSESEETAMALNHKAIAQIADSVKEIKQYFSTLQAVNPLELLQMPGVLGGNTNHEEALTQVMLDALSVTIAELVLARNREGEKLKAIILERLAEAGTLVSKVKPMMPSLMKVYQEKLTAKLQEALQSNDDERIRQEMVLYAQRIDVDEELSRLSAHIQEVESILSAGGLVGKKLDFLMQEMNREANTLGAKSVSIETTQISMQLKVLIEQMREQIQNIE
jgi:uncharacterized protein (TIGR00255 family)